MSEPAALQKIDIAGYHWRHRDSIIPNYPIEVQKALQAEYIETAGPVRTYPDGPGPGKHDSWAKANRQLTNRDRTLRQAHSDIAFCEHSLSVKAARNAALCRRARSLDAMCETARIARIEPPSEKHEPAGRMKRLQSEKWWRRRLHRHYARAAEGAFRDMGLVNRRKGLYCSDATLKRRREQKARQRELLAEISAINSDGEQFSLLDLAEKSIANPALRRAELMVRARGFEECAKAAGHVGEFYTFTTPSRFHAYLSTGRSNDKYTETLTPRDAQKWLCKYWARMRAKLKRLSVVVYGFRVAEPHHDGTTHWHLLLFVKPEHREILRTVCREYLLADQGSEQGARKHRFKAVAINPNKGTAAGYLAKYVAKNIDGFSVGTDLESRGNDATDTVARVDAWASTWGIRQFQQIGGPPVGVWRELRRIREPVDQATMESARAAADAGEWQNFIDALGGIDAGRNVPVIIEKEITGEINEYDELKAAAIIGVACGLFVFFTRTKIWFFAFTENLSAWTRVNNCTRDNALNFGSDHEKTGPPIEKEVF